MLDLLKYLMGSKFATVHWYITTTFQAVEATLIVQAFNIFNPGIAAQT